MEAPSHTLSSLFTPGSVCSYGGRNKLFTSCIAPGPPGPPHPPTLQPTLLSLSLPSQERVHGRWKGHKPERDATHSPTHIPTLYPPSFAQERVQLRWKDRLKECMGPDYSLVKSVTMGQVG